MGDVYQWLDRHPIWEKGHRSYQESFSCQLMAMKNWIIIFELQIDQSGDALGIWSRIMAWGVFSKNISGEDYDIAAHPWKILTRLRLKQWPLVKYHFEFIRRNQVWLGNGSWWT